MRYQSWLDPTDEIDGKPCFVSSSNDTGLRLDYMYCPKGPLGMGYYHMLTKVAYSNLYSRLSSSAPSPDCCCFGDSTAYNEFSGVKSVVFNRTISRKPDDIEAKRAGEEYAKGRANDWYNGTQNEQLALNGIQTAINL